MTAARDVFIVGAVWVGAGLVLGLVVGRVIHHADQLTEAEVERHRRVAAERRACCARCGDRTRPLVTVMRDGQPMHDGRLCVRDAHDVVHRTIVVAYGRDVMPERLMALYTAWCVAVGETPRPGPWDADNPARFAVWVASHTELEDVS